MPLRIQGTLRILNYLLPIFRAVQAGRPGPGLERDTSLMKVMHPPATTCTAICNVTKIDPTCHGEEVSTRSGKLLGNNFLLC
jgi:hypothetical protein